MAGKGEDDMNQETKIASIDAKVDPKIFVVGPTGKPLMGDRLQAFAERVNRLEALLGSSRTSCWQIGNLLYEIQPPKDDGTRLITKTAYRELLNALRISRSTAGRYQLVRRAWPKEDQVPALDTTKLYEEARKIIHPKPEMVRTPPVDPIVTLSKTVARKLGELVQRLKDGGPELQLAVSETVVGILRRSEELKTIMGSQNAVSEGTKPVRQKATRPLPPGQTTLSFPEPKTRDSASSETNYPIVEAA
jgi:hypothetical protein